MRVPYTWLKEYVDVDLDPEELAQRLTMAGLEVERVEYPWPGVVTAEIVWLQPIKGSDHLNATRVRTNTEEFSVVCGASNIKLHDKVPLATIGTKIGDITIQPKKAMGVLSEGMLCSPRELGLSDDHAGIFILPPETPLGVPFGKLFGEAVIDLDIKAHRGDLFSVVGIAREVSAFTGRPLREPEITVREEPPPAAKLMKLEVRDPDLCPRYTARVVRGLRIGPSPMWMQERLTNAGMRPINNVVDVTNYVMLELGQPLHAFDYDKVADHTIIVRRAHEGEHLTTLDGVDRALTPDMLLITDPAGPAVIAGIFGGSRVEVGDETTSVILEAAHFDPANIRRTSQALGLRTESSGRFEKNPDVELTAKAIDRAAQLIAELAGGTVAKGRVDFYPTPVRPRELVFHLAQVEWLTGMRVTLEEAVRALEGLGFGVTVQSSDDRDSVLRIVIPTWRGDIEESADIVEEIARIVGYDRIPSTIPTGPLPKAPEHSWFDREEQVRDILLGGGLTEIITYTLTSRAALAQLLAGTSLADETALFSRVPVGVASEALNAAATPPTSGQDRAQRAALAERLPAIALYNPMSSEMAVLRPTLLGGLLETASENAKHESAGLWFFELGRRYLPTPELAAGTGDADERRTVGAVITGPAAQTWEAPERDADFFDMKGVAELLLNALHVPQARYMPVRHPVLHPGRAAQVAVRASDDAEWTRLGILGEVHPEVAERYDLPHRAYALELDLETLFTIAPERLAHMAVPRYPAAQRDLAVIVPEGVAAADVERAIREAGGPLTRGVRLFDVYTGEGIPEDAKSLAYALTYQSPERTLTDAEVERVHAAILSELEKRFGARLR